VAELLKLYEPEIETITLIPSDGGKFEIDVNGTLIYSKLKTNRHTESGEVANLLAKMMDRGKNG
jgi:selenoprotein W-related protein